MFTIKKAKCVLCGNVKEIMETVEKNDICISCNDKLPYPCNGCEHDEFCKYQASDPMYCYMVHDAVLEYIKKNKVR
jgi:hypothetical protein